MDKGENTKWCQTELSSPLKYVNGSIVLAIRLANNKCRSPSQNKDQFDKFCSSFNVLMSNINDEMLLDFNARPKHWWSQDITNS